MVNGFNCSGNCEQCPLTKKCIYSKDFQLGVEVETSIEPENPCGSDYCLICDNCPVCENCHVCNVCDPYTTLEIIFDEMEFSEIINLISEILGVTQEETIKIIKEFYEREFNTELEDIDKTDIIEYLYRRPGTCEFCEKAREKGIITLEDIHQYYCERCNRCDGCEYVFNCSICPYANYESYCDGFSHYLYSKPYIDGSCGLEFPMGNFRDFKTLRKALIAVHNEYSDYMSPEYGCGGHTGISWENCMSEEERTKAGLNVIYFADLLCYMFLSKDTHERHRGSHYAHMCAVYFDEKGMSKEWSQRWDKYSFINEKYDYYEFRFPDTPFDPDNHVLLTAVLLSLCTTEKRVYFDETQYRWIMGTYYNITENGEFDLKERYYHKIKELLLICGDELEQISEELGFDLKAALEWRFEHPAFTGAELDLEKFPLRKEEKEKEKVMLPPLTAFE